MICNLSNAFLLSYFCCFGSMLGIRCNCYFRSSQNFCNMPRSLGFWQGWDQNRGKDCWYMYHALVCYCFYETRVGHWVLTNYFPRPIQCYLHYNSESMRMLNHPTNANDLVVQWMWKGVANFRSIIFYLPTILSYAGERTHGCVIIIW